jgi:hypothetical protein
LLYVNEDVQIVDQVKRGLAEYASTNGIPIRVLFGRFSAFTPGAWTAEEAAACGTSLEVCEATGVTVVAWGSATDQYGTEQAQLPGAFYTDGRARNLEIKECVTPQEGAIAQGLPLEADGFTFGEFHERKVWIYFYMDRLPAPDKLNLEVFLFEPIRKSLDTSLLENFSKELDERAARAFARLMTGNPERRVQEQRRAIDEQETQMQQAEAQMLTIRSRLEIRKRELEQVLESLTMPEDYWIEEWNHLRSHPKIAPGTLTMAEQMVRFDTVLLNIYDQQDDKEIPLGRFRISVNMNDGNIKIENINNRRSDRDHPHVTRGNPCWGGYASEVNEHVQNNRLAALVEFIINYLQTYNPTDDWGQYIRLWRERPALAAA